VVAGHCAMELDHRASVQSAVFEEIRPMALVRFGRVFSYAHQREDCQRIVAIADRFAIRRATNHSPTTRRRETELHDFTNRE
jgi:hypothetical protein